jgi:hypothetical protein
MTISFNCLGNYGHIGNQMFQYASLKGIALSNNTDYIIPPKEVFGTQYNTLSKLDDCFELDCKRGITNFETYTEKSFSFDEDLLKNVKSDINLQGYFQSEKYFLKYKENIKKDFTFKDEILNSSLDFVSQYENLISLHIRRNDYVGNANHPIPSLDDYYKVALSIIGKDFPVLVFSDDPNWCKEQEIFSDDRFLISENDPYLDLCLMSLCNYHIIANSSFSWWGAWLSDSKMIISPKKWFGGQAINNDTSDLYCSGWVIL